MRCGIYNRVSTTDQNPELQLKECKSISQEEWGDPIIIQDKSSAWKDNQNREGFEKIKSLIRNKQINHLIVWDFDRLFRNRKKLISFFKFCKVYKCQVHSFRQRWMDELNKIPEPFDEIMHSLMLQILGWIAEEESTRKSERVKLAVVRKEGQPTRSFNGKKWGRKALTKNTINLVLSLNRQGLSMRQIAKRVQYWDKNNNKKQISLGAVHKIITEFKVKSH